MNRVMQGELVTVMALFTGVKIMPVKYWRMGREYVVRAVTIRFERVDGGRKYLCFGVDTGGLVAELRYDTKNHNWRLCEE